ncbi:MAG: hypothetical protein RR877_09825 [Aurantimicrobium sp.]|uniref:hypothetical protein n=1 Tax=Aurantimicrobium sp. TaxID=1930784 RepID=UPI002FCC2251
MSEDISKELVQLAEGNVQEAQLATGINMTEWVFANEKNDGVRQLFHTFMSGAFNNQIGLAICKNKATGKLDTLLVGVNPTGEGGVQLFPLAVVITEAEHATNWLSPDGEGGYVGASE